MMPMPQETITSIHQTPHRLVFEFAGAGSLALFWLHSVPGSSRTVLEATDRYAAASLADLIGATPKSSFLPLRRAPWLKPRIAAPCA
jgi:hypothetical protein